MTQETRPKSRFTIASAVLMFLFFGGAVLTIFEINIYRNTIIPWVVPTVVWLAAGLALIPLMRKHLVAHLKMNNVFYQIVYCLFGPGGIVVYLFMALNYYTASGEITNHTFPIEEKSSMPGPKGRRNERHPLVRFSYFDQKKELVFKYTDTARVNIADSVSVSVVNGGLGFDVLFSYDVVQK
jgi:hypothetical protein